MRPVQVREEIADLLRIIEWKKPRRILEVGTGDGGTLYLLTRIADPAATLISIDLPGGRFGGGYPQWKEIYYKSFALYRQQIHLIRGDSHCPKTLHSVEMLLNSEKLDFLWIDGDHSYEGVKTDFEMYRKLVGKGGLIAFHDIVHGTAARVGGVPKFWSEVKNDFRHLELVKDWKQHGFGIGVLYLPHATSERSRNHAELCN